MTLPPPDVGRVIELSILTVNYHGSASLLDAQRALVQAPPACEYEWIVVNHSPSDRIEILPELARRMRVLEQENLGFGRGVNAAARVARGAVYFLANPDVVFQGPLLDAALERLAGDPGVGVLGPRLLYTDGTPQPTARRFHTWRAALFARVPGRDRWPAPGFWRRYLMMDDDLERARDVDWMIGAALFVRRAALEHPDAHDSVFDPRYFMYFEDVDLGVEMWRRGWRVRFDPTLVATHAYQRASRDLRSRAVRSHAAAFLRYAAKWRGLPRSAQ